VEGAALACVESKIRARNPPLHLPPAPATLPEGEGAQDVPAKCALLPLPPPLREIKAGPFNARLSLIDS
jgi:hypothetical protein